MMYITYILREMFLFIFTILGLFLYPYVYLFRKSIWKRPKLWKWLVLYWFADTTEDTFIDSFYGVYEISSVEKFNKMNAIQKFILSYKWGAIRNPHWNLTMLFNPKKGEIKNVKVHAHKGDASPLLFRNKKVFGKAFVTFSVRGTRYFRYSFTRKLFKLSPFRIFGYKYINFMAGASDNRYLLKLRVFK